MTFIGRKDCANKNFVKLGGGGIVHHHKFIPLNCLTIVIIVALVTNVALLIPNNEHDPPLQTIGDVVGYIV